MAKETYVYGKRDLHIWQKRPAESVLEAGENIVAGGALRLQMHPVACLLLGCHIIIHTSHIIIHTMSKCIR